MIVLFLLDSGADVNLQGGKHGSAVQAAIHEGEDRLVDLSFCRGQGSQKSIDIRLELGLICLCYSMSIVDGVSGLKVRKKGSFESNCVPKSVPICAFSSSLHPAVPVSHLSHLLIQISKSISKSSVSGSVTCDNSPSILTTFHGSFPTSCKQ
jgi:hypothetical protein